MKLATRSTPPTVWVCVWTARIKEQEKNKKSSSLWQSTHWHMTFHLWSLSLSLVSFIFSSLSLSLSLLCEVDVASTETKTNDNWHENSLIDRFTSSSYTVMNGFFILLSHPLALCTYFQSFLSPCHLHHACFQSLLFSLSLSLTLSLGAGV